MSETAVVESSRTKCIFIAAIKINCIWSVTLFVTLGDYINVSILMKIISMKWSFNFF